MATKNTAFQRLEKALSGNWGQPESLTHVNTIDMSGTHGNDIIFRTKDKAEYEKTKLELAQNQFLANQWHKANVNLDVGAFSNLNYIQLMYRDADLMDAFPEIGAALDTYAEESCLVSDTTGGGNGGHVVNVYSKSDRIKAIIEDLLVNRLNLQVTASMIIRGMCKYGNQFMLLDVDNKLGIKGWRQLPVFDVERIEHGIQNPYAQGGVAVASNTNNVGEDADAAATFIWNSQGQAQVPFRSWQIGHFRLLTNSMYLPYGVSVLNSGRRHFRMLSLMEDMMFIYRLERSMERRIYKINVGAIDDADVPAYMEEVANRFKRTPIIDPLTGQVDLRKNVLSISDDIFIPVRTDNAPTPVDTLNAGQNLTAMDDIKFVQNKLATALRIPKAFMNFDEAAGDGKNLALMDIRFTRQVNHIQQAFLMELTKIVSIHLYLLGFADDITNFSLTMNNPSTQAEQLELENLQKKIAVCRDAMSDPGNGIPVMSQMRALKTILKWSEKDIKENLEEIRLERALAAELEKSTQIIKRTGIFDNVDRMYGEPGAEYMEDAQAVQGGDIGGMGGPGGGGASFGGGLDDLGAPGAEDTGDIQGNEGSQPTGEMPTGNEAPNGGGPAQQVENILKKKGKILNENKVKTNNLDVLFEKYMSHLDNNTKKDDVNVSRTDVFDKAVLINEEFTGMINSLDKIINENTN